MGFCEGGRKWSCPLTSVSVRRASTVYHLDHVTHFLALAAPMVVMNMPFRENFNWLKTHREN